MVREISIINKEEAYTYDELELIEEKLLPLSTSYTETGNVGRPAKDAQDKSAKTVANEESLDRGGSN